MDNADYERLRVPMEYLGYHWVERFKCFRTNDTTYHTKDFKDRAYKLFIRGFIEVSDTDKFIKENEFYITSEKTALQMMSLSELNKHTNYKILEPSAGRGDLLKYILDYTNDYVAVEKNRDNFTELIRRGYKAKNISFEVYAKRLYESNRPLEVFDRVIINPPFSLDSQHLILGYKLLKKNGIVVSVLSENSLYRDNRHSARLREFISKHKAEVLKIPSTNTEMCLVKVRKQ